MASTSRTRQNAGSRANTQRDYWFNLRLRNVWPDTSPEDVITLFSKEGFHPESVEVRLFLNQKPKLTEIMMTLPDDELAAARKWANGRKWRGQVLKAAV